MKVEIKNYTKIIKKKTILDSINLTFEGGRIYGIRGINGSGKTMLIRAICGLIYPSNGEVIIDDEVIGKDISFPKSVGVLIEGPAFLPNYTGMDNLKLIASVKKVANENDLSNVLKDVGLDPSDNRPFRKYSLGMKQKLGIACAFMEYPDIVILDEPINAIDKDGVILIREILDDLKKRDKIVIIACHDAEEMRVLADEIIQMEEGRIV